MKKIVLILFSIILITNSVFAISLFTAQDISKNYLFENEMVDSFSQPAIVCEEETFFVIPIINSGQEISFFVPVSFESGEVFLSKDSEKNISLTKTSYLLKKLSYSDTSNYLSSQLIDKIDKLISELNSKKSRLEGVIDSDYSYETKQAVTNSKNKIVNLINSLTEIKENLYVLLEKQQDFRYLPTCKKTEPLLSLFYSSFKGYSELPNKLSEYTLSVENAIKIIVSDSVLDDISKRSVLDFISVPNNLNSEINSIYNYLSSTSSFYANIKEKLTGTVGRNNMQLYIDNLGYRKNFVQVRALLYNYDPDLPKYANLDSAIKMILNSEYRLYWKNQELVDDLQSRYSILQENYAVGKISGSLNNSNNKGDDGGGGGLMEMKLIKKNVLLILGDGVEEYTSVTSPVAYFIVGSMLLLLVIVFIIYSRRKRKSSKKLSKSKKDFVKEDDFYNDDFPFNWLFLI